MSNLLIFALIFFLLLLLFIFIYKKIKIKLSILEKENEILKTKLFLLKNKINKYKRIFPILNNEDYSYFKKNDYFQDRGDLGELVVKNELEYLVKKNDLILFNDLYLSLNKKIMQIDHILVFNNCIFIIETKNWSMATYGSIKSSNWFQYYGNEKKYLNSPIKQNYSHLKFVLSILKQNKDINISNLNFYNLVVFVENNLNLTSDFYFENNIYFKGLNFCDLNSYIESVLNQQSNLCRDYSYVISISLLQSNHFDNISDHFENISRKEVK